MILVDANLLLYAYNTKAEHHDAARAWLEQVLSGDQPVRFAWVTLLAFLRIGTSHAVFQDPLTPQEAIEIVSQWLAQPAAAPLEPGDRHWSILSDLATRGQARGPLMMDAHLAALAIEHGATVCTTDRDFTRFSGVASVNPLDAGPVHAR